VIGAFCIVRLFF